MSANKPTMAGVSLRFALVGGLTALIHYGVLYIGVTQLAWSSIFASSVGFVMAVSFNYFMHYGWTFAGGADYQPPPHGRTLLRYLVMIACGFALNGVIMTLGVQLLGWHYLLTQLLAMAVVVSWNFILANVWVFKF